MARADDATSAQQAGVRADYERAARLLPWKIKGTVLNAAITPHWLDADRFWYRRESPGGAAEFVVVDGARGSRKRAFDHDAVAAGLYALTGLPVTATTLPFTAFELRGANVAFALEGHEVVCEPAARMCRRTPAVEAGGADLRSPDGTLSAFVRDHDLWLRETSTGAERALTTDGVRHHAYGVVPEMAIHWLMMQRNGVKPAPYSTVWSPDSRRIVVPRVDERAVRENYLLQSAPAGFAPRAVPYAKRAAQIGDAEQARGDYVVVDVRSGAQVPLRFGRDDAEQVFLHAGSTAWSPDGRRLYTVSRSTWGQSGRLLEADMVTGDVRVVFEEYSPTNFLFNSVADGGSLSVRILPESNEFLWFSERDGWGHLYLYNLRTGRLKRRVTSGDWLVRDIVELDVRARTVYFTGGGREPGRNPYYRHLYRASLDGGAVRLLTPEDADHELAAWPYARFALWPGASPLPPQYFSPTHRWFVDTRSTVRDPGVSTLRRASDGRVVMTLETADTSALLATGWQPPEPFTVKAADGTTDLYGLIYRPTNFDPKRRYPILDHIYQGPNLAAVPWNFTGFYEFFNSEMQSRAELGFIVVQLDGRGTANRSRAFRDYGYRQLARFGIEDHVAAIRNIAAHHPEIDVERVGIYGHSFGGYGTVRAMLLFPEFFKVGISAGGVHSFEGSNSNWAGQFEGPFPRFDADGRPLPTPPQYVEADNRRMADRLQGKLLLAYADLDENTGPATVLQLASAFVDAGKSFELVVMPNRNHYFNEDPYFIRRSWDFFVKNLKGVEPPAGLPLERSAAPAR